MKKSLIFCSALALMSFVACDDKSDLGQMQVNPQEPLMNADGVAASLVAPMSGGVVDIKNYENQVIPTLQCSVDESVPEGATPLFEIEVSKNEDFSGSITLPLTAVSDNTYGVNAADLDGAFRDIFGKAPYAKTFHTRVLGYLSQDRQIVRLGGDNFYYSTEDLTVTPIDLGIEVEEAYYLVGTINNWDLATAVKFSHSDQSQYDDPVFTLAVDIPAEFESAGWWWKIVPESAFQAGSWNGLFGTKTDGDSSLEGVLVEGGQAGALKVAGQYLFTINMLDCTYEVSQAIPMLYTPGNGNGWNFESGMLNTWNYADYFGFAHLNGDFKITDRPTWGGIEWSAGAEEGTIAIGAPGNIPGPSDGLYWLNVNIAALTYNTTAISSIGIIGGFPDNNWSTDYVELQPDGTLLVWTGTLVVPDSNIEWKFRCNQDWGINLGGELTELTKDGGNIKVEAGTYDVSLDLTKVPYKCTLTAK